MILSEHQIKENPAGFFLLHNYSIRDADLENLFIYSISRKRLLRM